MPCLVETCITRRFVNRLGFFRSQNVHSVWTVYHNSNAHIIVLAYCNRRRHYIDPIKTLRWLMAPSAGSTCEQVIFYWLRSVPLFFFSLSRNVAMYAIYFKVTFSTQLKTSYEKFLNYATKKTYFTCQYLNRNFLLKRSSCVCVCVSSSRWSWCFRPCVNPKANDYSRTVENCVWNILGIWLDS